MVHMAKLFRKGKSLLLAYDHGLEHGPKDFNLQTCNPEFIIDIATKAKYNGIILQHGIAEKYIDNNLSLPLIIKLNGKTRLRNEVVSSLNCSVKRAIDIGAYAVGYTLYFGSQYEHFQFEQFAKIVEEAHSNSVPVILWAYPRGHGIDEMNTDILAYAARAGLELGADILKMKYNYDIEGFKWIVKNAGKARVMIAGGEEKPVKEFLYMVRDALSTGVVGLAVGRNIWQHEEPIKISRALKKVVFNNADPDEVMKNLNL